MHNFSKQACCQLRFWKFNQGNLFLTSSSSLWFYSIALWWVKYCSPNFSPGSWDRGQDSSSEEMLFSKLHHHSFVGTPRFIVLCFMVLHTDIAFLQNEACAKQVCRCHFLQSVCSLCVFVSHFGNSCNILNPPSAKNYYSLKTQMIEFFSNEVFFKIKVCTFLKI